MNKRKIFLGLNEINNDTVRVIAKKINLSEEATKCFSSKILIAAAAKNIIRYSILRL